MASVPKRKREESSSSTPQTLSPPGNLPQLNELGLRFGPELFPKFGNDDDDYNSCRAEPIDSNLGFDSMGGTDEFIDEVRNRILFPVVNAEFVQRHGRYPPKGILLHGPPGTGKTLFAKCLAAELSRLGTGKKYTFYMRRGSDVLSCWVGSSEKNIRNLFARAVQTKPSIIFFDEADGLVPNRNSLQKTLQVYTNVVTSILSEMDKIIPGEIIVIFATNRMEALDPAVKRPGRVDIMLAFHPPNVEGRIKILEIYTKTWGPSIPSRALLDQIARCTNGFTGADLDKLCSEAFFSCIRRTQKNCGFAVSKVTDREIITEGDWMEALSIMKPSQSNVFQSYVQVMEVSCFIQPLVCSSTKSIVELLEGGSVLKTRLTGGPNCFLVWNANSKCNEILDSLVMPSVFGSLKDKTLFILNEESMLQEYQHFSINAIIDIVTQAKNCSKASVLFIPRIDMLASRLSGECSLLQRVLFDTANKSTLVVATAGCNVEKLPCNIQCLFDGNNKVFNLQKPKESERRNFFQSIFTEDNKGKDCNGNLVNELVSITDHDDLWSMITLHRELAIVSRKDVSIKAKTAEMKTITEAYRKNRLYAVSK